MKFLPFAACFSLLPAWAICDNERDSHRRPFSGAAAHDLTWAIQYQGSIELRNRDFYVVDLFDVSDADLERIHQEGGKPVAYFSSQYEDWRPDSKRFPAEALGSALDGWPGERWINCKNATIREIMIARLDLAKKRGFWGVDIDNVDFYHFRTGFANSRAAAIGFVRFLSEEAHRRGLKIGLKNAIEIIPSVREMIDFYVNEEALEHREAEVYEGLGKPVLNIEYRTPRNSHAWIYTLVKREDMCAWEKVIP